MLSKKNATLNRTYHVAATTENNLTKLYLNSMYDSEMEQIPLAYTNKATTIGKYENIAYTKGKIYSIRMYNRTLTQEEINHNYEIDKHRFKF